MESASHPVPSRHKPKLIALIVGLVALAIVGLLGIFLMLQKSTVGVEVPKNITDWATFQLYTPGKLPEGYAVDPDSFSIQEDIVVAFAAKNSAGSTIYFTEQQKPKNLDFDTFYREETTEPKTLSGVPFPTVAAKMQKGTIKIVSIVADGTWVIASTEAPLSEADMEVIAKHIKRH